MNLDYEFEELKEMVREGCGSFVIDDVLGTFTFLIIQYHEGGVTSLSFDDNTQEWDYCGRAASIKLKMFEGFLKCIDPNIEKKGQDEWKEKLRALAEGLEIENIDNMFEAYDISDYRNFGKCFADKVKEYIARHP